MSTSRFAGAYVDAALRERSSKTQAKRILATLLFVDVVESSQHAQRLGDDRWRQLLGEFHALVREEIARASGIEVDTAGDAFFVRFESPAACFSCARSIRDGVRRLGIEVRCGIHAGECELENGKPTGMAVHAAARIEGKPTSGEILVSETVKALVAGSGIAFGARGTHELKGVPDSWLLHAVVP